MLIKGGTSFVICTELDMQMVNDKVLQKVAKAVQLSLNKDMFQRHSVARRF